MNIQQKENSFNSKILLFGEYGLIHDSMGLTIPYEAFQGKLTYNTDKLSKATKKASNESLKKYATFLRKQIERNNLSFIFDIDRFEKDIANGMVFDSTIPQGFGVGSSGALVAALYDKYALDKIPLSNLNSGTEVIRVKKALGEMESYFHGKSSGIDPLICYMKQPLLINNKNSINKVGLPKSKKNGNGAIFLINTGKPGNTQPMVNLFLEKCKEEGFLRMMKQELIPFNNNCIKSFLKGEVEEMFNNIKALSKMALGYLSPMIPKKFHKLWQQGIDSQTYYLKLCGSGGGGFILGFTEDIKLTQKKLKQHSIKIIHRF